MFRRLCLILALVVAFPAAAQESYEARRAGLTGLARIFGELHHIRRMCAPEREADVWRDRMKRLIDLEQPAFDLRESMVGSFNDGYSSAQSRFAYCERDAEDYAAARAVTGQALISSLSAPLYTEDQMQDAEGVNVFRGGDPQ